MKPFARFSVASLGVLAAAGTGALLLGSAAAQTPKPTKPIKELMETTITDASNAVWAATDHPAVDALGDPLTRLPGRAVDAEDSVSEPARGQAHDPRDRRDGPDRDHAGHGPGWGPHVYRGARVGVGRELCVLAQRDEARVIGKRGAGHGRAVGVEVQPHERNVATRRRRLVLVVGRAARRDERECRETKPNDPRRPHRWGG